MTKITIDKDWLDDQLKRPQWKDMANHIRGLIELAEVDQAQVEEVTYGKLKDPCQTCGTTHWENQVCTLYKDKPEPEKELYADYPTDHHHQVVSGRCEHCGEKIVEPTKPKIEKLENQKECKYCRPCSEGEDCQSELCVCPEPTQFQRIQKLPTWVNHIPVGGNELLPNKDMIISKINQLVEAINKCTD